MSDKKLSLAEAAAVLRDLAKRDGAQHVMVVLLGPADTPPMLELGAVVDGSIAELISGLLRMLSESIPPADLVAIFKRAALRHYPAQQPTETIH